MLNLSAKIRKATGKKSKKLRDKGIIPAVLYGPKIKEGPVLELDYKNFEKIYKEAGTSSLITLEVPEEKKKFLVLVHDIQSDPLTGKISHVDFYQPSLEQEVEVTISLVFDGTPPAVKELGGTLVKNFSEVKIKARPQNLPHEIKINIETLKTFQDHILVKDLELPNNVKILKNPDEIIALVTPPQKVEEELEKPVEEKVEEVEKIEKKTEEKEGAQEQPAKTES